jgi:hypothetical protein
MGVGIIVIVTRGEDAAIGDSSVDDDVDDDVSKLCPYEYGEYDQYGEALSS